MIKNFLARVGCLTLIAVMVLGAWHFRGEISDVLGRVQIEAPSTEPSERLARQAEEKLLSLSGIESREVTLSEAELQSLLTFRVSQHLPEGIEDPLVQIRDSLVILSALLRPDQLDQYAPPEVLRQFLSDTARVAVTLVPGLRRSGTGQVTVTTLQSGALIVPSMMVPFVLQGIDIPGLDASGSDILVPLPPRVSAVDMDSSGILIRTEARAD